MKEEKYSIKNNNLRFSLLHLNYNETYISSIDCFAHKLGSKNNSIEKGKLHITTTSVIFESNQIKTPLFKLHIDSNFKTRLFSFNDILNYYNMFVPEKEKINLNLSDNKSIGQNQSQINIINDNNIPKNNIIIQNNYVHTIGHNNSSNNLSVRKNSKKSLLINANSYNDSNSYTKLLSKKMSIISPKNSTSHNILMQNYQLLKPKKELNLILNTQICNIEKYLKRIFTNENIITPRKLQIFEKKRHSSIVINETNNHLQTNLHTDNLTHHFIGKKSQTNTNSNKKRKSLGLFTFNSTSSVSHQNAINQINNPIYNSNIFSNNLSGFSDLFSYFKDHNLNFNKVAELFYLLNAQFNQHQSSTTSQIPNVSPRKENPLPVNNNSHNNASNNSVINCNNYYHICLIKAYKLRKISRDKIKPYSDLKNHSSYIFILEGKNNELARFCEDFQLILNELVNNKNTDETKLSSMLFEKKLLKFMDDHILYKEDPYQNNFITTSFNLNNFNTNNLNNNFSIIQEESNPTIHMNSQSIQNINQTAFEKISLHRPSQANINNILKKKSSVRGSFDDKAAGNINLNNSLNSLNNNANTNGNFHFNPNNIHLILNPNSNGNANNIYSSILSGDWSNFPSFSSKYKYILKATRLHPEKNQNGIIIINNQKITEFHSLVNNPKKKVIRFNLKEIKFIVKYRYLYKYKGLNIFLSNFQKSKIIIFDTEREADQLYKFYVENSPNLDKLKLDMKTYTNLWVDGFISNFDYLIYLNNMASRSFSDMSQYPVMPWIINNFNEEDYLDLDDYSNYRDLSKPIGAQNPVKLEHFREFYNESKEDNEFPYFYGTHYSSPALVTFFLSRSHPLFNLRLQAGGFGPADRLFQALKLTWETAYNPGTDVMELIPEFFFGDGSFLKNSLNLNFGKTQGGDIVSDIILPKWANNSPKEFVNIMRAAIESEYVSENLHNWIDLIFGYKQNGEMAVAADNLFHHITYEGNMNIDDYNSEEKVSLIIQILEFGQTPKQLFKNPHPKKSCKHSYFLNDQILISSTKEYFLKFQKHLKEKEYIESKYERFRRIKEEEKEALMSSFQLDVEKFNNKKKGIVELIAKKESEFKIYIETLLEQNKVLRNNFQIYDNNKDHLYHKWINNIKKDHLNKLEAENVDKANLFKYITHLEKVLDKYKIKELNFNTNIENKKNKLKENELEEKELKKELYELQRKLRKIPHKKQIYLNLNNNNNNIVNDSDLS